MPEAVLNGARIFYRDQGRGPALLWLHAFPLSGSMWDAQVAALPGHRHLALDSRGFGRSEALEGPTTMEQLARDAAALLDALGEKKAILAGLSMGGYVALAFYRLFPERVKALILADTRAGADSPEGKKGREENAQAVLQQGSQVLVERMLPKLIAPDADEAVKGRVQAAILACPPTGAAGALRGMALRPDSTDLLPKIACPTLVVVGAADSLTPLAESEKLHTAIVGSRLSLISGAGHLSALEKPDAFNAAVDEFLRGIR